MVGRGSWHYSRVMARLLQDPETRKFLSRTGTWTDCITDAEEFPLIQDLIQALDRSKLERAEVVYPAESERDDVDSGAA